MSAWLGRMFAKVKPTATIMKVVKASKPRKESKEHRRYWTRELRHDGVRFPRAPKFHALRLTAHDTRRKNLSIALSPKSEEYGVMYARCIARRPALVRDDVFQKNFWSDFVRTVVQGGKKNSDIMRTTGPSDWDFARLLSDHAAAASRGSQRQISKKTTESQVPSTAIVDGKTVSIRRVTVDGPGIYISRSPLDERRGRIRPRISARDVTVNLSHPTPKDRATWGAVVSDNTVSWIARWVDATTGRTKYVHLGHDARRSHQDQQRKFDVARRYGDLRQGLVRRALVDLSHDPKKDAKRVQAAVCFIMIDAFAIRPGSSSSSHVRGVTTLKAPNVTVRDAHTVALDFVGKDSIRYNGEMRLPEVAVRVIKGRIQETSPSTKLFPRVTAAALNEYLDALMPGLTAKVIRTYRASCTYQRLLDAAPAPSSPEEAERRLQAAATGAAMLCNHQHETRACARKFAPDRDVHSALHALRKSMHDSTPIQKDETQCWARQTTLANYIDPRITVAYCKQHGVPIERVYPRGLLTRFKWAMTNAVAAASTAVQYKFCSKEGT